MLVRFTYLLADWVTELRELGTDVQVNNSRSFQALK